MNKVQKNLLFSLPTLNRYQGAYELLDSVESGSMLPEKYLVIDNGGGFQKWLEDRKPKSWMERLEIIHNEKNLGVSASWNLALKRNYPYTVLGADDCLAFPETLEKLYQMALLEPEFGHYSSLVQGNKKHSEWVFFLQTKDLTNKVGLYDEIFHPGYFEDDDYRFRMKLAGLESKKVTNSPVIHIDNGGLTCRQFSWEVLYAANQKRYIQKWGGVPGSETYTSTQVNGAKENSIVDRPVISVVLPHLSLGEEHREKGLQRCVDSILNQTYGSTKIQIIVLNGEEETVPQKVARGVNEAYGDYIVFAANDMEFDPNAFLFAWEDAVKNKKALVAFNGGSVLSDEGNICEHFLIQKDFIKSLDGGELFSTSFHHTCVDNWLWAQAKHLDQAYRSERAKYTHYHFSKPGGAMDSVYNRGWDSMELKKDRETLKNKLSTLNNKNKLKIVVYTITKNEEKFIKRYCESAKDADEIIIVDTGSTDKTVEVAKECGATVHSIFVSPWRFDVARNASLAVLPMDADICIAADADEVLEPGWREEIERVWTEGTTRLRYVYDWGMNNVFVTDKIHSRKGYYWKHPCHETLFLDMRLEEKFAHTDKLIIRHLPDNTKSRGSYLDLLNLSVKEDPHCVRHSFYYARELYFYKQWENACAELKRYLNLEGSNWSDERAYAMRLIGECLDHLGKSEEALTWFIKGTEEASHRRETWYALTNAFYNRSRWQECADAARKTLNCNINKNNWPMNPDAWGAMPHDYLAIASYHLADKETAVTHGKMALSMADDGHRERMQANLVWYLNMKD